MSANTILITTSFGEFVTSYNTTIGFINNLSNTTVDHINNTNNPHNVSSTQITFTANTTSNVSISSTTVQAAIEETYKDLNETKVNRSGDTITGPLNLASVNVASNALIANSSQVSVNVNPVFNTTLVEQFQNDANSIYTTTAYANNSSIYAQVKIGKSRGTKASPLHANSSFVLGRLVLGTAFYDSVFIEAAATQTHSASVGGTEARFYTTTNNSNVPTLKAVLTHDGNLGVGNSSPTHKLSVNGTSYFSGASTFLANTTFTQTATANNFVANVFQVTGTNFFASVPASNQRRITFDTNDFINYNISTDVLTITLNNNEVFTANATIASAPNFAITNQPTQNSHAARKDFVEKTAIDAAIVYAIALG